MPAAPLDPQDRAAPRLWRLVILKVDTLAGAEFEIRRVLKLGRKQPREHLMRQLGCRNLLDLSLLASDPVASHVVDNYLQDLFGRLEWNRDRQRKSRLHVTPVGAIQQPQGR